MNAQHAAVRAFAWGGALLFAAALIYFLFSYSVTFGEIVPGNAAPGAIAFDVALFTVFALHHSVFARLRVRGFVRRTFPDQLERSVYVWVASLMLIGVCYNWRPVPGVAWQVSSPWIWGIRGVQLAGIWLTLRGAAVIDGFELAGVRQTLTPKAQFPTPKNTAATAWELEVGRWESRTEGPYGWVRHPIYLGWILVVFSVGTMTMTRLVFAGISTVYLLIAIPFEERTIRAQSSGGYDDYSRRVRWKLIPGLY